ncbi:type II toxin-antitoxin system HicB family antitoxin [Castellaniella sp. UC4442_H9]|jgi:predicted RNase H-like HicB family nuclease|nr:type II toxin-antitoxin system HicB family antitoxin [Castellaniella sp.]
MLYPIHVDKDQDSAYGASFTDLPGCFAGAEDLQGPPRAAVFTR